ncbi:MAG: DUF4214 domain-containing protein, partial [Lachnospiraceae bacterium]|nr:DUF4214 domain-containing protein [Lachnospiraceae bacterium]
IVAVDHGDAHPRSVLIGTYSRTNASEGKLDIYGGYTSKNMLTIPGNTGANYTGTSVGAFEISDKNYMVAASRVEYDDNFTSNVVRNAVLLLQPRGDFSSETKEIKFSSFAEGSGQGCGNPYLVKANDNLFVLMWEVLDTTNASTKSASQTGKFQAVVIDGSGNRLSEIKTFEGDLSDCKPVVNGNSVYWYTTGESVTNSWGYTSTTDSEPNFYKLTFENSGSSYTLSLNENKQIESAEYTVNHWIEKANGGYSLKETEKLKSEVGSKVTPSVKSYTGYNTPATQTVSVSSGGTTKVDYYYDLNTYKLTWNMDGGSASGNYTSGNVKYQTSIIAPQPVKKGYVFDGWDIDVPAKMPAKNLTIKAKWIAEKVKLSMNTITCTEGDTITLKVDVVSNSNTVSWNSSNSSILSLNKYTSGSATFVANKAGKATITVKSGDKSDKCVVTVEKKNAANEEQVKAFVERFYTLILSREPDEDGINYWTQILLNKEQTGAEVAFGFVNSPEFTEIHPVNDEEFVKRMYAAFFDRDGGTEGEEWWLGYLNKGYTRNYVLAGFTNSNEFGRLCAEYGIAQGSLPMDESMRTNPNPQPQPGPHAERLN